MGSFIVIAHALIEDTIIFLTSAPLLVLLVPRLAAAYGFISCTNLEQGSLTTRG